MPRFRLPAGKANKCPSKSRTALAQDSGVEGESCHPGTEHPTCLLLAPALRLGLDKAPIVYCFAKLTPTEQV